MIVVDTNIVVYLLLPGPQLEQAQAVFRRDSLWAAPLLWRSEFRNVLARYIRQHHLSLSKTLEIQSLAEELFTGREYGVNSTDVLTAAAATGCSAYDCEFSTLARKLGMPLITNDQQLLTAFPEVAITPQSFCRTNQN